MKSLVQLAGNFVVLSANCDTSIAGEWNLPKLKTSFDISRLTQKNALESLCVNLIDY